MPSEWYADKTPEYWRLQNRKSRIKKFGITLEDWDAQLQAQDYKCAACTIELQLERGKYATDHDHNTMKFRGILCNSCNVALGLVSDSTFVLERLIKYLNETGTIQDTV